MPKGFDYEAALERASQPPQPTEEQLRRFREETLLAIHADPASQEPAHHDLQIGQQLLLAVEINRQNLQPGLDLEDCMEIQNIIDESPGTRQDRR